MCLVMAGAHLLGLTVENAKDWFKELDSDGSNDVDMDEFLAVVHKRTTTVAQDIGRLGKQTEAGKHRYEKMDSNNTGGAEVSANSKVHARKQASQELSKANDEFKKRQQKEAINQFRKIDTDGSGRCGPVLLHQM
jgi:Ca2+-binding EF-hand superfamily protein